MKRVVEAILYFTSNGCKWKDLPKDFPPKDTVFWYFNQWSKKGTIRRIMQHLAQEIRKKGWREPNPSLAIIDSQTVKTGTVVSKNKGFHGGKRIKGRGRHIAVDSQGLPIVIAIKSGNIHDTKGGMIVIKRIKKYFGKRAPKVILADKGYRGEVFSNYVQKTIGASVEIGKNLSQKFKAFIPDGKRWVVERSFAWLNNYRRLDKDQEKLARNSRALVSLAFIQLMLRRLTDEKFLWT